MRRLRGIGHTPRMRPHMCKRSRPCPHVISACKGCGFTVALVHRDSFKVVGVVLVRPKLQQERRRQRAALEQRLLRNMIHAHVNRLAPRPTCVPPLQDQKAAPGRQPRGVRGLHPILQRERDSAVSHGPSEQVDDTAGAVRLAECEERMACATSYAI